MGRGGWWEEVADGRRWLMGQSGWWEVPGGLPEMGFLGARGLKLL